MIFLFNFKHNIVENIFEVRVRTTAVCFANFVVSRRYLTYSGSLRMLPEGFLGAWTLSTGAGGIQSIKVLTVEI